jgi:hypothetical protein
LKKISLFFYFFFLFHILFLRVGILCTKRGISLQKSPF